MCESIDTLLATVRIGDSTKLAETKIATLEGVREHTEGMPVELWMLASGSVVVRAFNEGGFNYTNVDLAELLNWLKFGSSDSSHANVASSSRPALE